MTQRKSPEHESSAWSSRADILEVQEVLEEKTLSLLVELEEEDMEHSMKSDTRQTTESARSVALGDNLRGVGQVSTIRDREARGTRGRPQDRRARIRGALPDGLHTCLSGQRSVPMLHKLVAWCVLPVVEYFRCSYVGAVMPNMYEFDVVCWWCSNEVTEKPLWSCSGTFASQNEEQ